MPESIVIFLDFQNVHLTGHGLFGGGAEPYRSLRPAVGRPVLTRSSDDGANPIISSTMDGDTTPVER
jgi:hypothetical protein